jgi:hypothetical protein
MVHVFIPTYTGDVNSLEEKVYLHGGSFGSQGGTLDEYYNIVGLTLMGSDQTHQSSA